MCTKTMLGVLAKEVVELGRPTLMLHVFAHTRHEQGSQQRDQQPQTGAQTPDLQFASLTASRLADAFVSLADFVGLLSGQLHHLLG